MLMVEEALTHCRTPSCGSAITYDDVVSEKGIKNAPTHLVYIYRCPQCGRTDRLVAAREIIRGRWRRAVERRDMAERLGDAFADDMVLFDNVHELVNLWNSYGRPPRIEGKTCDCSVCKPRKDTSGSG